MRVIHVKERSHPVRYDNKCGGGPCGDINFTGRTVHTESARRQEHKRIR